MSDRTWAFTFTGERLSVGELGQSDDPPLRLDSSFKLQPPAAAGAGVTMETVVILAIGVLATIFLASFVALVVVCRHRYCHPHDLLHHFDSKSVPLLARTAEKNPNTPQTSAWELWECPLLCFSRPTVDLIGAMETQSEPSELELDDVVITNPHIEAILENEDWIEDAS